MPRFGYSTSFPDLFSSDEAVSRNYIAGVLIVGLLILIASFCWLVALLLSKCCAKRTGFLSGAPLKALRDDGTENPWIARARIIFAISGVFCIIFAIVLATAGIGNLSTTTATIGNGAEMGYDYFRNAQYKLISVYNAIAHVNQLRFELQVELQVFLNALVEAKLEYSSGDLENATLILLEGMTEMKNFLSDNLRDVNSTITNGQDTCVDVMAVTESIDLTGVQWAVGLTMTIIPAMLLGCLWWVVFGKNNKEQLVNGCRTWFIFPLFVLMTILSITLCSGIVIGNLMNSDFCAGGDASKYSTDLTGPDASVLKIMVEKGTDPQSFEFRAAAYVISRCNVSALVVDTPLADVEGLERQINRTLTEIPVFIKEVTDLNVTRLSHDIGYNVTDLERMLLNARGPLKNLWELFIDFLNSTACMPLFQIYAEVAHQATCTEAYSGTYWTFMSLLWISMFGLLAITFRAALYPVVTSQSFEWDLELLEKQEEVAGGETEGIESAKLEGADDYDLGRTAAGVEADDDGALFHSMAQYRDDVDGDAFHSVAEPNAKTDDGLLQDQPTAEVDCDVFQSDKPRDEVNGDLVHSGVRPSHEIDGGLFHSVVQHSDEVVGDSDLFHSEVHRSGFVDPDGDLFHSVLEFSSEKVDDVVWRSVEQTSDALKGDQPGHGYGTQKTVGTSQSLRDCAIQSLPSGNSRAGDVWEGKQLTVDADNQVLPTDPSEYNQLKCNADEEADGLYYV